MNCISKSLALILILIITISSLSLIIVAIPLGRAQSGTNESGIISSNTTWTKANSPYNLTGNIFVNNGVTLTLQAGVTVNFNGYYLMVEGTLVSKGTDIDKIQLNRGFIIFRDGSTDWNQLTNSGCIVENTALDMIKIQSASPKINKNSMYAYGVSSEAIDIESGSPIITNNNITGPIIINGSPTISNNNISTTSSAAIYVVGGSPVIENNIIAGTGGLIQDVSQFSWTISSGAIMIDNGSPSFINNTIDGTINDVYNVAINACGGTVQILNNNVYGEITGLHVSFAIESNYINGSFYAKTDSGDHENIQSTIISNRLTNIEIDEGTAKIENNIIGDVTIGTLFVMNALGGIDPKQTAVNALIENNTITGSINFQSTLSSTMRYNNLQIQNGQKTIKLSTSADIDATNNWWGTTDKSKITTAIYDFNNNFNLGKVTFVPFLPAPNPQAPTTPTATPTPTPSPSPTPIPEFPTWIVPLLLIIMVTIAGLSVYNKSKRSLIKKHRTNPVKTLIGLEENCVDS